MTEAKDPANCGAYRRPTVRGTPGSPAGAARSAATTPGGGQPLRNDRSACRWHGVPVDHHGPPPLIGEHQPESQPLVGRDRRHIPGATAVLSGSSSGDKSEVDILIHRPRRHPDSYRSITIAPRTAAGSSCAGIQDGSSTWTTPMGNTVTTVPHRMWHTRCRSSGSDVRAGGPDGQQPGSSERPIRCRRSRPRSPCDDAVARLARPLGSLHRAICPSQSPLRRWTRGSDYPALPDGASGR